MYARLAACLTAAALALPAFADDARQAEADSLRHTAEAEWQAAQGACLKRYFVNACLHDAREARLAKLDRARAIERQLAEETLAAKRREAAERDTHAAAQRPDAPAAAIPPEPAPIAVDSTAPSTASTPAPHTASAAADARAARSLRTTREHDAARAKQFAHEMQRREDAARAADRRLREQEAQDRAERTRRDRERYDARLREYQKEHPNQPLPTLPE